MSLNKRGFTLMELLVAVIVSTILISASISMYVLIRKSIAQDQAKSDSGQNARVALDRMSRELRQSPEIITDLPLSASDTAVTQPHAIEFADGHANDLTYKRYYMNGTILQMQIKEYYFSSNPSVRVVWNATDSGGHTPISSIISTQDIADMVRQINFYGDQVVQVEIVTGDGVNPDFDVRTSVQRRN